MSSVNNDSVDCETMLDAALDSPAAFENDNTSSKESVEQKTTSLVSLLRNTSLKPLLAKNLGMNSCQNLSVN